MEKFTTLTSSVVPLNIRDIDTDMIIPANFLTSIDRKGFGENLFKRLRDQDPNFAFNLPQYKFSQILLADDNFGCGSSREHAVWALLTWGIKVVISKSFADIFANNSAKNGLLTISLKPEEVDHLFSLTKNSIIGESLKLTVDLHTQKIILPDNSNYNFEFDPFRKHCILNGLDDMDYLLSHKDEIKNFKEQKAIKFFSSLEANN